MDHVNGPEAALFVCSEGIGVINHDLLVVLSPSVRKWIQWLLRFIRTLDLGAKESGGGQELLLPRVVHC